jgi:putative ABC transport system substrate-binding protein
MNDWIDAFVQRLSELRWVVGNTVAIEYRWAEARNDRFAELAAEFVRLKVDAIVTAGTPSVLALMQATSSIPIVFVAVGDPVANGLVKSLARSGGNVTGLSNLTRDLAGKRVEILRGHTRPLPAGNPGKCCECRRGTGNARRSGGSPNPRL